MRFPLYSTKVVGSQRTESFKKSTYDFRSMHRLIKAKGSLSSQHLFYVLGQGFSILTPQHSDNSWGEIPYIPQNAQQPCDLCHTI